MTNDNAALKKLGVNSIRIGQICRTEAIGDMDATALLERHQRGDWIEIYIEAPGFEEGSMVNFILRSYVVSKHSEEPEGRSIMIFTALATGRTVIFRECDVSRRFIAERLWESPVRSLEEAEGE